MSTNALIMNNICYDINVRNDNCCDKFLRKILCCCSHSKIYHYGDSFYSNLVKFTIKHATYESNPGETALIPNLEFINDSHITFTNIVIGNNDNLNLYQ